MRRVSTRIGVALVALAVPVVSSFTLAAHAASPSYVALGDSYASGTGTRDYINDGTSCQRSVYAYPSLISSARGYALNFRACSGAKIPDVTGQLSALSTSTAYVSVSVGGNDAGFSSVITECAKPGWMSDCNGAINTAQSYINNTLPGALSTLYASIKSKSPSATVVVVGYPRIFQGEDCNAGTWFSPDEETRLNQTADLLNSKLSAAAGAKAFTFANPTTAFTGHAVCDSVEWLNGLSNPVSESYHPNKTGHSSGYTPLVSPKLTGSTVMVTSATLRTARASSDRLASQQRQYAAADSRIAPETFARPDLHSAEALAAAKAAGVNVNNPASVDAADRAYSDRQAAAQAVR